MKNPWEYMGTEKNPNKKKNEKNNKDDSDDEDSKGGKEDDPYIIRLIKVFVYSCHLSILALLHMVIVYYLIRFYPFSYLLHLHRSHGN